RYPTLHQQPPALAQGAVWEQLGDVRRQHHVGDPQQQVLAQRSTGVERRELLAAEPLHLEQRDRQRVAQREGDRRAGRGRQGLGTRLLGDTRVEHDLRLTPEDRLWIPRDR